MDKKIIAGSALAGLFLAGGIVGTVSAQTLAAQTGLTLEQAAEIALLEVPGEIREVDLEREDGMQIYEIEILSVDGVEMEVEIAADTGDVLEIEAEGDDHDKDDS